MEGYDVKLETGGKQKAALETDTGKATKENEALRSQLKTAMDRVAMLELGITTATTTTRLVKKEDQDSIEIGAQSTGRVKVYGDFGKKSEFAKKLKDALEILAAARETMGSGEV